MERWRGGAHGQLAALDGSAPLAVLLIDEPNHRARHFGCARIEQCGHESGIVLGEISSRQMQHVCERMTTVCSRLRMGMCTEVRFTT